MALTCLRAFLCRIRTAKWKRTFVNCGLAEIQTFTPSKWALSHVESHEPAGSAVLFRALELG
jgi:hypothetical protein